ncbi:EF-P 5-aminopentanol modification-associated protein YfmH [Staphylospora marina]|uniref:EF-P 5-aminopentanol modification-associated protein YfmH n=1 Tax=Staphylospora marina TaxID=2490858 RepID=UPI000F5BAEF0|nr:pitrilysin family protein [Staphylospora marina]
MQKIEHRQVAETLYMDTLPNGLEVVILPKPDFNKTYATFTTRFGSVDNTFAVGDGEKVTVPDGIAHFLEHKMFEQPTGTDVFQEFARQGASANAFTSFTRTAYLFSATSRVEDNLKTLIDFVQTPHFTDQNVEKEKGIIGQEIRMYDDNPDWRSYFGLIEAMYKNHPVRIDIAGTVESIADITKELLYTCYETFYHPSNMLLFVVGPVDPENILELVRNNQAAKTFEAPPRIRRFFESEPDQVNESLREVRLSVGVSKCLFGFKEASGRTGVKGDDLLKQEMATKIALEALIGPSSDLYQALYDDGLIDETFGFDYTLEDGYGFSMMGGDTRDPDALLERIRREFRVLTEKGIDAQTFDRLRKKSIGSQLRSLNSPEWIANQFTRYRFNGADMFRIIPVLEELRVDDINKRLREHVSWDRFAVSLVRPL